MKTTIRKGLLLFALGFIAFFVIRLVYGYVNISGGIDRDMFFDADFSFDRKNYASSKYRSGKQDAGGEVVTDQKYEKVASVAAESKEFDKDEEQLRATLKEFNALLQFEQRTGLKGNRRIDMAIGVPPDNFDVMVAATRKIGKLVSINIEKLDKTNEYKQLNAKRISLEKARTSLISLKDKGGSIEDLMNLEQQILSTEQSIQDLGVSLGDFDAENEFCTVKFSMRENTYVKAEITTSYRLMIALQWAIKYYFVFISTLLFASLASLALTALLQRLNFIPRMLKEKLKE
jgi:hypothetical protein